MAEQGENAEAQQAPPDSISVGGDEGVAKLTLAARWAERHASDDESIGDLLRRFRKAYAYIDDVTKGIVSDYED